MIKSIVFFALYLITLSKAADILLPTKKPTPSFGHSTRPLKFSSYPPIKNNVSSPSALAPYLFDFSLGATELLAPSTSLPSYNHPKPVNYTLNSIPLHEIISRVSIPELKTVIVSPPYDNDVGILKIHNKIIEISWLSSSFYYDDQSCPAHKYLSENSSLTCSQISQRKISTQNALVGTPDYDVSLYFDIANFTTTSLTFETSIRMAAYSPHSHALESITLKKRPGISHPALGGYFNWTTLFAGGNTSYPPGFFIVGCTIHLNFDGSKI